MKRITMARTSKDTVTLKKETPQHRVQAEVRARIEFQFFLTEKCFLIVLMERILRWHSPLLGLAIPLLRRKEKKSQFTVF